MNTLTLDIIYTVLDILHCVSILGLSVATVIVAITIHKYLRGK